MATTTSRWREASRRAIALTLERLPGVLDPDTVRRALAEAYPFGERAHHPYRIWCDEVRKTLARFAPPHQRTAFHVAITTDGVFCSWCRDLRCLACMAARDEWQGGADRLLSRFDPATPPTILADALDDHGYSACAKLMRSETARESS